MSVMMVYITTGDVEEAREIGGELVMRHLAACVNIFEKMESMYWWEGKLEHSEETVLLAKTTPELVEKLIQTVKNLHSYDCPAIVAMEAKQGNEEFFEWVKSHTG
ncbi:divalent-cation tolerance protein CutA [Maridesulfovibrio salexigens]|uniref:CutA1 divalent ion tolerance protein n=1 Tax=Maridesulfovibrio salexigens (strain ATCC 14822 / DSM 2638 / NCIMB 8403 / VKM B-1763) TaxID=526222 RepID=C6BY28_MARSD|nr:divalent-cation tolerance protein CutA [Maridesulfovibrio salexigens]ACS80558.1 CutA1 divalent ion tolerance protein [Maridesulfovibrio salexigens DSM 2638]